MYNYIVDAGNFLRRMERRFRREDDGSILVEMTLITPLMIALSAGVFEFGNIIHRKLLVEAGLKDATRYYARCTTGFATVNCEESAQNIAKYGKPNVSLTPPSADKPRVAGWDADVVITTYDTSNPVDSETGLQSYRGTGSIVRTVQVTTSYEYSATSLLSYIGVGAVTIKASHEERFIGY